MEMENKLLFWAFFIVIDPFWLLELFFHWSISKYYVLYHFCHIAAYEA